MNKDLRLLFMGTPEFAVPSLKILVENGYKIVAVITAPDKPQGRGRKPSPSAVKEYAFSQNIPILQPVNLKDPSFLNDLKNLKIDLQIVVAFRMLPEQVWNMPPLGTFNLHASLLPQYRGAAPIHWAVINGELETGVTTFFLKHEIDTGKIIFQEKMPIESDETTGELYSRLMSAGAGLVLKTVKAIESGDFQETPQPHLPYLKPAPKIFRETCEIIWEQPADKIYDFIRGLSPFPAAWTTINGSIVKIFNAHIGPSNPSLAPGEFETDQKSFLNFGALEGTIAVDELQWQGRKRMNTEDFLRGNSMKR